MTLRAHYSMCRFAESRTGTPALDTKYVKLIKVPRGIGKSTLITQARALQLAMKYPECALLISNETERGAMKFLGAIKDQLTDNKFLRALFPDRIPEDPEHQCKKWSETEVILPREGSRKEPTFMAIGVGGSLTGMHPDHAFIDDMVSDDAMENARIGSFLLFEKTNRWISRLRPIVNMQEPWHGITFVGTPWWEGDSYEFIEKAFGYGEKPTRYKFKHSVDDGAVEVECYTVGDLAVYARPILENGTSFFPERWSDDRLAKMRQDDPLLFAANMMLNPTAPEVVVFKPTWRRYFEFVGTTGVRYRNQALKDCSIQINELDVVVSVDPAFTEGGTTSARQAIMATGGTPEGLRIILKAQATRQSLDGFVKDIVETCKQFHARKFLIERQAQQIAFINTVRQAFRDADVRVSFEEVTSGGRNKDLRIATLETYFERGQIYGERNQHDFWREYDTFPRGKMKDLLDTLAYQPPFWNMGSGATKPQQTARVAKEVEQLYARMGKAAPVIAGGEKSWERRADGSRR